VFLVALALRIPDHLTKSFRFLIKIFVRFADEFCAVKPLSFLFVC